MRDILSHRQNAHHDDPDDSILLDFIKQGDTAAFSLFYKKYHYKVYHISLKYLQTNHEATATVKEIFATIWNSRNAPPHDQSLQSWTIDVSKELISKKCIKKLNSAILDNRNYDK